MKLEPYQQALASFIAGSDKVVVFKGRRIDISVEVMRKMAEMSKGRIGLYEGSKKKN